MHAAPIRQATHTMEDEQTLELLDVPFQALEPEVVTRATKYRAAQAAHRKEGRNNVVEIDRKVDRAADHIDHF